eukprot:10330322-Karenia_brevis.AAC.1
MLMTNGAENLLSVANPETLPLVSAGAVLDVLMTNDAGNLVSVVNREEELCRHGCRYLFLHPL